MKRVVALIYLIFVAYAFGIAQQKTASISFSSEQHDFGQIKEEGGPASYSFEFTNTGAEPLIISNVKASCGCTTPEWSRDPVSPGAKGFIKATYNPSGRPGKFSKTITVTSNADIANKVLTISGEVISKPKTEADNFPQAMGDMLRFKTTHMAFSKIYNDEVRTDTMEYLNISDKQVHITFGNIPPHIKIKAIPENVKAGEKGKIIVTYDAKLKKDWGFNIDRINLIVNDDSQPNNKISVSADIQENFSNLTEQQRANAAHVDFENKEFNFGTIKQGESVSTEFKFKNTGKSDLMIRKTKASCGCTAVAPPQEAIKPGESTSIKATFNSHGKKGKQNKTITVITNDPDNPTLILKIVGDVLTEENNTENK